MKGGVANAGAGVRAGDHGLRPSNPHTPSVHRFLAFLADSGFTGASRPVGVDPDGRERLGFLDGDVAVPPYPAWVQTDAALGSVARLMRRMHDAARSFVPSGHDTWSAEMADPAGGPIVCHNDVCLENVVFRDGGAIGFLDFDFAAPGRPVHDVMCFARMCVPIDDGESAARLGWLPADLPARLRLVADEYGLAADERRTLVESLDGSIARGGAFVLRRVEAGEPNFIEMWNAIGGMARFDRRRAWWAEARPGFEASMQ